MYDIAAYKMEQNDDKIKVSTTVTIQMVSHPEWQYIFVS